MASANEEDVVIMFRQAVEEEMRRMQSGSEPHEQQLPPDAPLEEVARHFSRRCDELSHEVALLRTIVLRLVSEPVDKE